jgi:hypothetical protein
MISRTLVTTAERPSSLIINGYETTSYIVTQADELAEKIAVVG